MRRTLQTLCLIACLCASTAAYAQIEPPCCVLPDNGAGTLDIPANCPLGFQGSMQVVNGLIGGTLQASATLKNFATLVQVPGGTLGGNKETWTAQLSLHLVGTGAYFGYNRTITIPISTGESHSAPRVPYAPLQPFNTDLYYLQGQIPFGDPDFDLLRISAGDGFGLPSPGHTTLVMNGTYWEVNSFFDIYYRIDFIGHNPGPFGAMSGSTLDTQRLEECAGGPTPVRGGTWGTLKLRYR